ncbi:MAG: hypothetical protein AAFV07_19730, partial [Bacteroidota bacterium]
MNSFRPVPIETNFILGLKASQQQNKPLFVHMTCWACMGTNEFHTHFLKDQRIHARLRQDYVVVELYVDDRQPIEAKDTLGWQQIGHSAELAEAIREAKTIGEVNSAYQLFLQSKNVQPQYWLMDTDGSFLIEPFAYCAQ